MKRYLLFFLSLTAHAQFNNSQKSFGVPNNALSNPGFEAGLAGWVKSGGNWSLSGSANAAEGNNALAMEFTAADQTLKTALTSVPRSVVAKYGGACMASFVYFGGGGNTYEYYVENSSSVVVGGYTTSQTMFQITADASSDYARPYVIPFVCDEDETYRLVIKNKTASTQTLYVDNAVLGGNDNIGTVAQATLAGRSSFAATTSCLPTRTNTAMGDFGTLAACPGPTIDKQVIGSWQTTDADYIQQTINNLPAGEYELLVSVPYYGNTASAPLVYAVTDSTTTSGYTFGQAYGINGGGGITLVAQFSYSSAGNRTFKLQCSAGSGSCNIDNQTAGRGVSFQLKRFPTASETIARLDAPGVGWTAFTPTNTQGFGTITGGNFQYICDAGTSIIVRGQFTSGTVTASTAQLGIPTGFTVGPSSATKFSVGALTRAATAGPYGIFAVPGNTYVTFGSGATSQGDVIGTSLVGSTESLLVEYQIPVTASSPCAKSPQVLIPGSVYSSSAGVDKVESGTINCDATPSVVSQDGDWLATPTQTATGRCTAVFKSGIFSAAPRCFFTGYSAGNIALSVYRDVNITSTSTAYGFWITVSGASSNGDVEIMCKGPR